MKSIRRWKSKPPEHTPSSKRWNGCASWCRTPPQDRPNWPLRRSRCQKCRAIYSTPWADSCWSRWKPWRHIAKRVPEAELGKRLRDRIADPGFSGMNRELHIVGFKVGRETYGVPITALRENVPFPEIPGGPDPPDYVEGVINLRGKIVSVLDL